ncbi:glutamyl-tRNA amidotransferase [Pediculus humanus corporis]|uniref:Glutamyl-tRNA amidotransferase n=1 Tax=Pediculus humanus subsp. corporis TaxID=121224 RepID=E0VEI6_PEDHC|nr:glutamyl-tRNA amidotransferase [Pediculus humanus corporis]EEB11792.1 glutamyl-tRNA amidotransferase [Pediculus humanus corporis]
MTLLLRLGSKYLNKNYESIRWLSNTSAVVTKIHRKHFLKHYPTLVVEPDGSTYTVRYHEPRKIIKLPLDLSKLSEEERNYYLQKRKPKKKVIVEESFDDNFDSNKYLNLLKKKN